MVYIFKYKINPITFRRKQLDTEGADMLTTNKHIAAKVPL